MELSGKVVVVTGAGGGIGGAVARAAGEAGAAGVALLDRRADGMARAVADVAATGVKAVGIEVDVASQASVEAGARRVEDEFGAVHVLVNNAGVVLRGLPLAEISNQKWDWVLGVNLFGVVNGVRAYLPRIRASGGGHIVNVASIAGFLASDRITGAYHASKYAVVGYSEMLAAELAGGNVGISIVAPAAVNTSIYENSAEQGGLGGTAAMVTTPPDLKAGKPPSEIAALIVDGIRHNRLYIMTHPETKAWVQARFDKVLAAFDG
jgi:NAD(P)-dependent dehydrogenase (short-subunit alcohol dehydrogenase family)